MNTKKLLVAAACGLFTLGSVFAADPAKPATSPEADRLLQATCSKLTATKAYAFKAEIWEDFVSAGHKVSKTKRVEAQVRRPNRVHMEIRAPKNSRGFWYDGRSLTLVDNSNNLYGSVPVPGTIDELLDAANDKYGINFPLEDLLVNDPYTSATKAIQESAYFGKVQILGTTCHHIAFSTPRVDWQLWIEDGANPLPRKLVITYKLEDTAPQYTAIFSEWKLKDSAPDKLFVFTPAKGAAKIEILPGSDDE